MRLRSGRVDATPRTIARRLAVGLLGISFAVALPAAAQANNLFSVDPSAASTGPIVTDAAGNGYIAWEHRAASSSEPTTTIFCKIPRGGSCTEPIVLPLPAPGDSSTEAVTQAFPVLGATSGVLYVVAPRYVAGDTLIWTSQTAARHSPRRMWYPTMRKARVWVTCCATRSLRRRTRPLTISMWPRSTARLASPKSETSTANRSTSALRLTVTVRDRPWASPPRATSPSRPTGTSRRPMKSRLTI